MNYGTLIDNQLHPAPRAARIGGAVVFACALLLGGCSLAVVKERDAATLPTTKAIYQAFMDAIDRIKERLDREGD